MAFQSTRWVNQTEQSTESNKVTGPRWVLLARLMREPVRTSYLGSTYTYEQAP